jgi:hypothetical protein
MILLGGGHSIQPNGISRFGGFDEPILGRWTASMSAVELDSRPRQYAGTLMERSMSVSRSPKGQCDPD